MLAERPGRARDRLTPAKAGERLLASRQCAGPLLPYRREEAEDQERGGTDGIGTRPGDTPGKAIPGALAAWGRIRVDLAEQKIDKGLGTHVVQKQSEGKGRSARSRKRTRGSALNSSIRE